MYILKISAQEYDQLLETGWRRFGLFFFKPDCIDCFECRPIRIRVNDFALTKSQKRVLEKNKKTKVVFSELQLKDEMYEIYDEHSRTRFDQETTFEDFQMSFFSNILPARQSEFYNIHELIASGFIDISKNAVSSVYFYYKRSYNRLSLGTFGALKEIEYAKNLGRSYYYLGFYIKENKSMAYKNRFKPCQLFDWYEKKWEDSN